MDVTGILDQLNPPQREAVSAEAKPTLVLAGAGSGKTRVLVHRIAWLLQVEQVSPFGILAVTFTNKAAGERCARVEAVMGGSAGGMWIGTFHSIAHRLLRHHWREAGLPTRYSMGRPVPPHPPSAEEPGDGRVPLPAAPGPVVHQLARTTA